MKSVAPACASSDRKMLPRFANATVITALAGVLIGCGGTPPRTPLPPIVPGESFDTTDISPHPDAPILPGRNYVYCPTFRGAWSELQEVVFKAPIKLSGAPPLAEALNATIRPSIDLPKRSYLVRAGLSTKEFIEATRREVAERFPKSDFTISDPDPHAIVAYAFLEKALTFAEAFDRLDDPVTFEHSGTMTKVAAFGFRGDLKAGAPRTSRLTGQVEVLSYANDGEFVLALRPEERRDRIILAKMPRPSTLDAAIQAVRSRIHEASTFAGHIGSNETLIVPLVSLAVLRRYTELEGRTVENLPWSDQGYYLQHAEQSIRLRLDEFGAALSSMARNEYVKSAVSTQEHPRQFIFNSPFLLLLERERAIDPYCAIWIETPEVLVSAAQQ